MSNEIELAYQPTLPDKMAFAKALAQAGMIPRVYQGAPANVLVAIEFGEALGIKPIVAINEINVINGTPSPSASLMASLARNAGHKVRVTGDEESAKCEIVRADDPEYTHTATWTMAKAKSAGLWGKGHWSKDPATMLKWRAISECVRFACSEVLGGLKYTPDEVLNFDTPAQPPQQAQSSRPRTISEALAPVPDPEPETAEVVTVDVESLLTAVEEASSTDVLRELWKETVNLTAGAKEDVRALIQARLKALEDAQKTAEAEPEQPTLDAEIVDDAETAGAA